MNIPLAASAARVSGCDVLVIGGGSAGSTTVFLAERGYRVMLPGKDSSSLFHSRRILLARRMCKLNIQVVAEIALMES